MGVREYLEQAGPVLAPERVGREIAQLAAAADQPSGAYLLTPEGLSALP